jgi:hypothetical protein
VGHDASPSGSEQSSTCQANRQPAWAEGNSYLAVKAAGGSGGAWGDDLQAVGLSGAEHGQDDVAASAGQAGDGSVVALALDFLEPLLATVLQPARIGCELADDASRGRLGGHAPHLASSVPCSQCSGRTALAEVVEACGAPATMPPAGERAKRWEQGKRPSASAGSVSVRPRAPRRRTCCGHEIG